MADIDEFATGPLEESKRFLERASAEPDLQGSRAYLHASLMLGFCALEAHVNAIADEFTLGADLTPHDKGILLEKEVRLDDGEFKLTSQLKMVRLEDRIQFLHARFSTAKMDKTASWWSSLKAAMQLRNDLTHPKGAPVVTKDAVESAIQAVIDTLNAIYLALYKEKFPAVGRGLQSKLTF